jgi:aldehyde dehydrogenase (NAD+)
MGAIVDHTQLSRITALVDAGREEGAEVFQADAPQGCFYPPTLITNVQSASKVVQEEIFGPVLVSQTFRTPEEAIALANNSKFGLAAGVWTENIGLGLDSAIRIKAGVLWVNSHNLFDAAAGFGGYKESGFGREGGKEGLYGYTKPAWQGRPRPRLSESEKALPWGTAEAALPSHIPGDGKDSIDRTPKMYIGGKQKRPDANYSLPVYSASGGLMGQVGDGNRKDVRDAVEAAHAASGGWGKRAAHDRAQIMFFIAENLHARFEEFSQRIASMTGCSVADGEREVEASISRLFTYAAWADKYGGSIQETPLYGLTACINEPVGVIGIACPEKNPLLSFISLVAPAVVRGNTVVAIPSEKHPLSATDLYQVLDTSDLPGGVINIVTGQTDVITKTLAMHQDVDAMWYFGSAKGSYHTELESARNMKRTFVSYG